MAAAEATRPGPWTRFASAPRRPVRSSASSCGRWVCTQTIAPTTTSPPAIWTADSASPWIAHASTAPSTGSSVAITAARAAGRCRTAVIMHANGTSVPPITTYAANAALRPLLSECSGNVQIGCVISQNTLERPNPHTSVVAAGYRWPACSLLNR